MDAPVQTVLFLGIIPALFLLFIGLKGYDGYYKDKTIFLTFIMGIVFGILAAIVRYSIGRIEPLYLFVPFIPYIILFAFFEQLLKTIVLNIRRLQYKKETAIYGLSLGLGFGSSFTPFIILSASSFNISSLFLTLVAFGSLGFILFHAASGAYIGYGISSGKMTKHLFIAIALQIPFNFIAVFAFRIFDPFTYIIWYQIFLVIYGLIFFIYVIKKVMPKIREKSEGNQKMS